MKQINLRLWVYRTSKKRCIAPVICDNKFSSLTDIKPFLRSREGEKEMAPTCFCGVCGTTIKENIYGDTWCSGDKYGCLKIDRPRVSDIKQLIFDTLSRFG